MTTTAPVFPSRTFGYARVSTTEQTSENQRLELEAAEVKVEPHRFMQDVCSGKVPASQRPQFGKLLERIEAGDTLVVSKLDRLGRDSIDVEATLRMLEGRGVGVRVLALGNVDLASTAGKLLRKMLAAVAEMERDLIVERTQAGLARAKAEGKTLGRKPKTSPADRQAIRERRQQGESAAALGRAFGVSKASVVAICKADRTGTHPEMP